MAVTAASADLLIDENHILDVTAVVGSGDNTSYAVIDFEATGGTFHAFAYNWSGSASAHDMLLALADAGLTYDWTDWGSGIFTDNFAFGGETGDTSYYWAHSTASPAGNGTVDWTDAWSSVDATMLSNGFVSGWYNGFNEDYSAIPPSLPLSTIPAPATLAALALAGFGKRRNRR
ncbi:MAG: hypothetical protein GY894_10550 [Planctomycetes bacterium]|nr:hypothetical protein [Planctomycetota bacterium]MCP4839780.1 hypothetical protein [Planctomycetota bacterium]